VIVCADCLIFAGLLQLDEGQQDEVGSEFSAFYNILQSNFAILQL
jgi:hypothetical protein